MPGGEIILRTHKWRIESWRGQVSFPVLYSNRPAEAKQWAKRYGYKVKSVTYLGIETVL